MKFPKNYLKNLTTQEEYERAFMQAANEDLSLASMMAVYRVAKGKGIEIRQAKEILGI